MELARPTCTFMEDIMLPGPPCGAGHFGGRGNAAGMSLYDLGKLAVVPAWRGGM